MFMALPNSPTNPVSLMRKRYFSERESTILVERVLRDDPNKGVKHESIAWRDVKAVVSSNRALEIYPFAYDVCTAYELAASAPFHHDTLRPCASTHFRQLCTKLGTKLRVWRHPCQCDDFCRVLGPSGYDTRLGLAGVSSTAHPPKPHR